MGKVEGAVMMILDPVFGEAPDVGRQNLTADDNCSSSAEA
jgi:hypothetical protein